MYLVIHLLVLIFAFKLQQAAKLTMIVMVIEHPYFVLGWEGHQVWRREIVWNARGNI